MTPSTEAGRRFAALWDGAGSHYPPFAERVAAIEHAARAAVLADLAKQVEGLQWPQPHGDFYVDGFGDCRADVLRLIAEIGGTNE